MAEREQIIKTESKKRTATECGFINDDHCPPAKKIKLDTNNNTKSERKGSKRKVALILSYLGTNYHGSAMSKNQSVPTVSGTVFDTICKIGAISESNASDPKKVSFSASSRTDKGVHAAAATFALKMINLFEDHQKESILNPPQKKKKKKEEENTNEKEVIEEKCVLSQWNEMRDLMNESLPDDIMIHGIQRTTKNFDPRFKAWSRVYRYLIPSYLFDAHIKAKDIANIEDMFCQYIIEKAKLRRAKKKAKQMKEEDDDAFHMNDDDLMKCAKDIFDTTSIDNNKNGDKDVRFIYRISDGLLERLKVLCQIYVGTRNYHNFTRRTHPNEDRAKRLIHSVEIIDSSLVMDGIEYLQFEIHGASFLYHQIRKMIGFLVILMRNIKYEYRRMEDEMEVEYVDDIKEIQRIVFSVDYKMTIPLAPSQGLYLKSVEFDEYNKKCVKDKQEWKQLKLEKYNEGIDAFVMNKILPSITRYEVNDNVLEGNQFAFWLYDLDNDFKFEIIKITKELIEKLKEKGIEYINADTHESVDKFYEKIMNRSKQNKIKQS